MTWRSSNELAAYGRLSLVVDLTRLHAPFYKVRVYRAKYSFGQPPRNPPFLARSMYRLLHSGGPGAQSIHYQPGTPRACYERQLRKQKTTLYAS